MANGWRRGDEHVDWWKAKHTRGETMTCPASQLQDREEGRRMVVEVNVASV